MSGPITVPAYTILEAVRLAVHADIDALRRLVAGEAHTLKLDLVLRILLTYLPESTEPSVYTGFLHDLVFGNLNALDHSTLFQSGLAHLTKDEAQRRVRKLRLLPLENARGLDGKAPDIFTAFLLNRARRIDQETGLLSLIRQLLEPFLTHSSYLQKWFIGTLLPLLRFNYEYYPQRVSIYSLETFEKLQGRTAINALLSEAIQRCEHGDEGQIDRDLRGLVGPWIYGHTREKRRKIGDGRQENLADTVKAPPPLLQHDAQDTLVSLWTHAHEWLLDLSVRDFQQAVRAIERWDGPRDTDYGGWNTGENSVNQEELTKATTDYGRAGLATIYACHEVTTLVFQGMQNVLGRIALLNDIPISLDLATARSTLSTNFLSQEYISSINPAHLFQDMLLHSSNPLTNLSKESVHLGELVLASALILEDMGHAQSIKKTLQLALFGTIVDQRDAFRRVLHAIQENKKKTDQAWNLRRQQLLWLRKWSRDDTSNEDNISTERTGLFKHIGLVDMEIEILKALLTESRYQLVVLLHCATGSAILPRDELEKAVLEVAMVAYDNASNGNRTRGGVKKASDIIQTFRQYFPRSRPFKELDALLLTTHALSFYALTLQHGVPFQPVNIRVQSDPLSLVDKVLKQNPRSYTKLDDLLDIGRNLIKAGLVHNSVNSSSDPEPEDRLVILMERRIIARSIEAALAEDDFDTAYSYVVTRLSPTDPSGDNMTDVSSRAVAPQDDVTWRAAYQAGRSHINSVGAASQLRRLEQRMELLTQALLLAPSASLEEVLGTWRQREEEMNKTLSQEFEEEKEWDDKGSQNLPGGFDIDDTEIRTQKPREPTRAAMNEEAPMGLFDVARGAAAAISKSAFPLRSPNSTSIKSPTKTTEQRPGSLIGSDSGGEGRGSGVDSEDRIRKRDMVSNMVTGGLASGIGWVLGAPSVRQD